MEAPLESPTPALFTDSTIQELWESKHPLELLLSLLHRRISPLSPNFAEESSKGSLCIAEFLLHSLVHSKASLDLTSTQSAFLLCTLLELLENSASHGFSVENSRIFLQSKFVAKCVGDSSLFSKATLKRLIEHLDLTYFQHYRMYQFLIVHSPEVLQEHTELFIDTPTELPAHFISSAESPVPQSAEESPSESAEPPKHPEAEEEYPSGAQLDEDTKRRIDEKVARAKEVLVAQLQERQVSLGAQLEGLDKQLRSKKKKK